MVLTSCSKSCGTQAQLTGSGRPCSARTEENAKLLQKFPQSATDFVCRLSGEVTENTFLSVKKTKTAAYCGNFWGRSLACFMRAAQFASVSSCAQCLLKHFRCKIIWNTDDRWIPISRDTSQTVLWVCGLNSWLRTKSLTVSTFSSVQAQIDGKSK